MKLIISAFHRTSHDRLLKRAESEGFVAVEILDKKIQSVGADAAVAAIADFLSEKIALYGADNIDEIVLGTDFNAGASGTSESSMEKLVAAIDKLNATLQVPLKIKRGSNTEEEKSPVSNRVIPVRLVLDGMGDSAVLDKNAPVFKALEQYSDGAKSFVMSFKRELFKSTPTPTPTPTSTPLATPRSISSSLGSSVTASSPISLVPAPEFDRSTSMPLSAQFTPPSLSRLSSFSSARPKVPALFDSVTPSGRIVPILPTTPGGGELLSPHHLSAINRVIATEPGRYNSPASPLRVQPRLSIFTQELINTLAERIVRSDKEEDVIPPVSPLSPGSKK
jgi:hypothetical protein